MPKRAKELSAIEVKRLQHPNPESGQKVRFPVGGVNGLYLQFSPNSARSWLYRYSFQGRRKSLGLGPYPDVQLAIARDRARSMQQLVWKGVDPHQDRAALRRSVMTFAAALAQFEAAKLTEINSDKHRKQWVTSLERHANPMIGTLPVSQIEITDILRVLEPIWTTKTSTAKKVRHRLEAVLAWATVAGHRKGDNPARWKGNLDAILPKPSAVSKVVPHPAVSLDDAADWFADVRSRTGTATRALEFLAITAARSGEVRGMVWSEIDKAKALWTIPADRMKTGAEHRVPLTDDAMALLDDLPRMRGSDFVFPAAQGGALSDMSISACMKRIHEARAKARGVGYVDRQSSRPAVPHGLRSLFRDWAAERTDYSRDMAEIALAHTVGSDVERAYRRSDMLDKRRQMMAAYGRFLLGETSAIVVKLEMGQ